MSTLTPEAKQLLSTTIRALPDSAPGLLDVETEGYSDFFRESFDPSRNTSRSFQTFIAAVQRLSREIMTP